MICLDCDTTWEDKELLTCPECGGDDVVDDEDDEDEDDDEDELEDYDREEDGDDKDEDE